VSTTDTTRRRYVMPLESIRRRVDLRDSGMRERATVNAQLLTIIPPPHHAHALTAFGMLEQLDERRYDALQKVWLDECDRAYAAGRKMGFLEATVTPPRAAAWRSFIAAARQLWARSRRKADAP